MPFDGSQLDETTRVLIEAADLLRKGWCTRARQQGDAFCALGAVAYAATGDAERGNNEAYRAAYKRLASVLSDPQIAAARNQARQHFGNLPLGTEGLVAQFNNSQTSVEPILDWFNRAISAA